MATVTFNIPDVVVQELNGIAIKANFANAKLMIIAYLKATIKADRENAQRLALPVINTNDIIVS